MALPSAMEAKRTELKAGETAKPVESVVPAPTPQGQTQESQPPGDQVTISREEFNKLQAASDTVKAAEGKTLAMANDLSALTQRLTELESAAKDTGKPAAAASPGQFGELATEQLTEESLKDFDEDSVKLMQKLAQNAVAAAVNPLIKKIEQVLGDIDVKVATAKDTVQKVSQNSFMGKVQDKVSSLGKSVEELVHSEYWGPFLQSTDEVSGLAFGQIAVQHNNNENVEGMAKVLKTFHAKYFGNTPAGNSGTGYEGGMPNATNSTATNEKNNSNETLNFSDRQEAHRKYLNKEIQYDEYIAIKDKFDKADKEGRVDYNK